MIDEWRMIALFYTNKTVELYFCYSTMHKKVPVYTFFNIYGYCKDANPL